MRTLILIIILMGWAESVQGAVLLNEVAWMGTAESHLCEWIELHNDGTEAVSLNEWSLQIGDGPVKPFADGDFTSYVIPGGGFFVLERLVSSCPDPVPSTAQALLPFGSIPNTNTTIKLFRDAAGTVLVDQLASGEDWVEVGGDNETKDTAQYSQTGWQTAPATPGRVNTTAQPATLTRSENRTTTESERSQSEGTRSTASERTTISLAEQARNQEPLTLTIEYPTTVYVAQPVTFTATPSGRGKTVRNSLRYHWNFGDLHTATHETATHTYAFPGEYVVSLAAQYFEYEATETRTVVVLPVPLRMNITADGHLNIHNTAPYEVDVSGFTLSTVPSITFPPRTKLTARGTMTVPNASLGTRADLIILRDRSGAEVSGVEPAPTSAAVGAEAISEKVAVVAPVRVAGVSDTVPTNTNPELVAASGSPTLLAPTPGSGLLYADEALPAKVPTQPQLLWYGLLVAVLGVGILAIFFTSTAPKRSYELADED